MRKMLPIFCLIMILSFSFAFAQTNEWGTEYAVYDDGINGTGDQTSSVAAIGPNRFVALVTLDPPDPPFDNMFDPPGCYLVGYWDADSTTGRVPSPINGQQTFPEYSTDGQFTIWEYSLIQVTLDGAWQIAANEDSGFVYVANNDELHNILVFKLTADGVEATPYRMETGSENIFAIEVDTNGYVYVVDYEGTDVKTDEVKVFAGIGAPNTTWGDIDGHNDSPVTTIDLPPGTYCGVTVSGDGTALYVSSYNERRILRYDGDPVNGYTLNNDFSFTLAEDDTVVVEDPLVSTIFPTVLGLAYMDDPPLVYAVADTLFGLGVNGGYSYGRIYVLDPTWGSVNDTIDIAEWNFQITGAYNTGSENGRAGGFTSVVDVDVESSENAVYCQTYYGWAVEKWIFDGDLNDIVNSVEKIATHSPARFELHQNYPNPFNPNTTIEFEISRSEFVTLEIYNAIGQRISTLLSGSMTPGAYKVEFSAGKLPSGIYFYRLTAGDLQSVRKMVLTK